MRKGRGWIFVYPLTIVIVLSCIVWGNRVVNTFSETIPMHHTFCIIIDAGHGGIDGGAISCTGRPESMYNLEIALRLEALFHLLGFETKMIRREDVSVYTKGDTIAQKKVSDLKERVRIVNETPNALLLSIHQNYYSDSRYSGAQIFYPKTTGSDLLASKLQSAIGSTLDPGNHRKCKKSTGVYLMEKIQCTGVLIECGFLSCPQEEARLRTPIYQKKISAVITTTVSSFLSNT